MDENRDAKEQKPYPYEFVGWRPRVVKKERRVHNSEFVYDPRREELEKKIRQAEKDMADCAVAGFMTGVPRLVPVSKRITAWRKFSSLMETHINSKKKYDEYDVAKYYSIPFLVESMLKYTFELKYGVDHEEELDLPTIRSIAHIAEQLHTLLKQRREWLKDREVKKDEYAREHNEKPNGVEGVSMRPVDM